MVVTFVRQKSSLSLVAVVSQGLLFKEEYQFSVQNLFSLLQLRFSRVSMRQSFSKLREKSASDELTDEFFSCLSSNTKSLISFRSVTLRFLHFSVSLALVSCFRTPLLLKTSVHIYLNCVILGWNAEFLLLATFEVTPIYRVTQKTGTFEKPNKN